MGTFFSGRLEAGATKACEPPGRLTFILKENVTFAESAEDKPGVVLDYDGEGNLVSMEIADPSRRVTEAREVEFRIAG